MRQEETQTFLIRNGKKMIRENQVHSHMSNLMNRYQTMETGLRTLNPQFSFNASNSIEHSLF